MINGVTPPVSQALPPVRQTDPAPAAPVAQPANVGSDIASAPTLAAALAAASSPPIDNAKIAEVRQAIASGKYPIDPQAIAQKMVDLDLPPRQS